MISSLAQGLALGVGAAVPLGPVNVEIARRTLRSGFLAGFAVGCGAVTVDVVYAIVSTLGVGWLQNSVRLKFALGVVGGLFLLYLGAMCLRGAIKSRFEVEPAGEIPGVRLGWGYVTGLAMTFSNPMTLVFWFVGVPGVAADLSLRWVCVGVFVATISWVCFFAGWLSVARRLRGRGLLVVTDLIGGVTLIAFGALAIWRAIGSSL